MTHTCQVDEGDCRPSPFPVTSRSFQNPCSHDSVRPAAWRHTPSLHSCRVPRFGSIFRSRNSYRSGSASYAWPPYNSSGLRRGRPGLPATVPMLSTRTSRSLTSGMVAGATSAASETPWPSTRTWCLTPGRHRSVGYGPLFVLHPLEGAERGYDGPPVIGEDRPGNGRISLSVPCSIRILPADFMPKEPFC